jgi:hypothetical protein
MGPARDASESDEEAASDSSGVCWSEASSLTPVLFATVVWRFWSQQMSYMVPNGGTQ